MKRFAAVPDAVARTVPYQSADPRRLLTDLAQLLEPYRPVQGTVADVGNVAVALDSLNADRLARVFSALAPQLGPALARWWLWAQDAPYQSGWGRRGFRSPYPETSRHVRMSMLMSLVSTAHRWPQGPGWFADWASYLAPHSTHGLAELLTSEIDAGQGDIAELLVASVMGRHPISGVTVVGLRALLGCQDPARWEQVATLLRTAGRQEGLRSAVLEASDLAHPGAFARIIDVVLSENLTRFASTARAASVWFGEQIDVRSASLPSALAELQDILRSPNVALAPDESGSPRRLFLRLWAAALVDAFAAARAARDVLTSEPDPAMRKAAARLLAELGLTTAQDSLRAALADDDLGVYANAVSAWPTHFDPDRRIELDDASVALLLERIKTLGPRVDIETGLIGTRMQRVSSSQAADVILAHRSLAAAPTEALKAASPEGRVAAVRVLSQSPGQNRSALFGFMGDPSGAVRGVAAQALETLSSITEQEAILLEGLLRRRASDLRSAATTLLLRQPAVGVRASVERLAVGTADQARSAAEIAGQADLHGFAGRAANTDKVLTVKVRGRDIPAWLVPSASGRTPAVAPSRPTRSWEPYWVGCRLVVTSLRAWLSEHADVEVRTADGQVRLLANLQWLPAQPGASMPLPEIVNPWWERIKPQLHDGGIELLLLRVARASTRPGFAKPWVQSTSAAIIGAIPDVTPEVAFVWPIIHALAVLEIRDSWIDVALDAMDALWHGLPAEHAAGPDATMIAQGRRTEIEGIDWNRDVRAALFEPAESVPLARLNKDQLERMWRLSRFIDEPEGTFDQVDGPTVAQVTPPGHPDSGRVETLFDQTWRRRPPVELLARAATAGLATPDDVSDALLHLDRPEKRPAGLIFDRPMLRPAALFLLTGRTLAPWARHPEVTGPVDQVRRAVIDSEIARGELAGPLTPLVTELRSATGIGVVVRLLVALDRRPFARGYIWTDSRESSLSNLIRKHFPGSGDTAQHLSTALREAKIGERRAVEFGVYAPQWAGLLEEHLHWPGFESAVWWVHAHTRDDSWFVDREIREEWASAIAQRTPLDPVELARGAADVAWFASVIQTLGQDRFRSVLAAAKYASTAGGHKRAELFSHALLGQVHEAELVGRIRTKRHQDSVRALGLLSLSGRRDPALLERYRMLRGFVASDKTSGSARRASESTAAAIGIENLARTAGYVDPGRLTWAMEAEAVRDLADGPLTATDGPVSVSLSIDDSGAPVLSVRKAGRPLKAIPAASAKVSAIAALKSRHSEVRSQGRRMRQSLEQSCLSGERFDVAELRGPLAHPVLAPMLRTVVMVSDEGVIGFPEVGADSTPTLLDPDRRSLPLDGSALRIAHPLDLLASGQWPSWQRAVLSGRMTQPFRQAFRELYVPTAAKLDEGPASRRYAGQQIEPGRASGLFRSRGWVADQETGFARTFHAEKLTAWCSVVGVFGTPGEAEDPTIDTVTFTTVGTWLPMLLDAVPPRLFSEVMRDLDLVVSVAHAGGVDPETSASTTEIRGRLVQETADLLGLSNVEVTDHHVLIRGQLGRYSVHLGSGQVHRVPGNAVCIIPISAQHRGRIFLPFADDDPRTAEVISKVLMLARDDKIRDPSILGQLT